MSGGPNGAQIEVWAPAKLNLFLEILTRRPDGYHEIVTVMTGISLYDTLLFQPTNEKEISFTARWCSGPVNSEGSCSQAFGDLPDGNDNLVVKALGLIRDASGYRGGARVELIKRIPSQAGLGGASSDAAAALLAANRSWTLDWPTARLEELAAQLGSDVPFFLRGGTGICEGRGEKVRWLQSAPRLNCVVVRPPYGLSTVEVYQQLKVPSSDRQISIPDYLDSHAGTRTVGGQLFNRLQSAAETCAPELLVLRDHFGRIPFLGHQLSGSGSSYFGVSANAAAARRCTSRLRATGIGQTFQVVTNCSMKLRQRRRSRHQ